MSNSQDYLQKAKALIDAVTPQGKTDAEALRWLSDNKKLSLAIASALVAIAERLAPLEVPEITDDLLKEYIDEFTHKPTVTAPPPQPPAPPKPDVDDLTAELNELAHNDRC